MWSVTTSTEPSRIALNRSPSGTRHRRWSHGSYVGVKCSSTRASSLRKCKAVLRQIFLNVCGRRRLRAYIAWIVSTFFARTIRCAAGAGSTFCRPTAIWSTAGSESTHVGERCSIVTCSAVGAIDGTNVIAVAPLPMTTTFLPA